MKKIFYYDDTCIGRIGIAEKDGAITNIIFSDRDWIIEETELIKTAKKQLDEYFEGKRKSFDFPTRLEGTEFQLKVWKALESIPYGKTATYKEIAELAGCPKGYRAVGLANNRNPISIVYPCHRVVGSDGSLTGYGGGIDTKAKLLELEKRYSTGYAFGVDIGGTEVKIGLFDDQGSLIYKTNIPTRKEDNCGFETRFIAVKEVNHTDLETVLFAPVLIHSDKHLVPVLSLGAACTCVEGENCVL